MYVLMLDQSLFLCKAFIAHGAVERLLAGVNQQVNLQVVLTTEALLAQTAGKRTLTRVNALVAIEVLFGFERFATVATRIRTLSNSGSRRSGRVLS